MMKGQQTKKMPKSKNKPVESLRPEGKGGIVKISKYLRGKKNV